MNVLFIHEVDLIKKVVFEIHTLAEQLSLLGHNVFAIDYESMWTKENLFDFRSLNTKIIDGFYRAYPEASISLRRPGFIKVPGLSRLVAAFTHYQVIQQTIIQENINVIVLYSVPTNGLQTIHLARKFGIPVVFRSIDILHQLVPYSLLRPITRILEKCVYSNVDMILSLSPKLSEYVIKNGAKKEKVRVLLLGVDTRMFHPMPDSIAVRQKWQIENDEQVILFIGTLFEFSGLDNIIPYFYSIKEQIPKVKLLIVGDGPQRPKLEKLIDTMNLRGQVIITGFEPFEAMPQYINLASICINTFPLTDATREIMPGKLLQYLACGKGVVATPLPGTTDVIPANGCGMIYASTPEKMVENIVSVLQSSEYQRLLGKEALNYVQRKHSYDQILREFEALLEEAITEKRKTAANI
jgi:glycosyltransferase involved in cell wall biosynthesis